MWPVCYGDKFCFLKKKAIYIAANAFKGWVGFVLVSTRLKLRGRGWKAAHFKRVPSNLSNNLNKFQKKTLNILWVEATRTFWDNNFYPQLHNSHPNPYFVLTYETYVLGLSSFPLLFLLFIDTPLSLRRVFPCPHSAFFFLVFLPPESRCISFPVLHLSSGSPGDGSHHGGRHGQRHPRPMAPKVLRRWFPRWLVHRHGILCITQIWLVRLCCFLTQFLASTDALFIHKLVQSNGIDTWLDGERSRWGRWGHHRNLLLIRLPASLPFPSRWGDFVRARDGTGLPLQLRLEAFLEIHGRRTLDGISRGLSTLWTRVEVLLELSCFAFRLGTFAGVALKGGKQKKMDWFARMKTASAKMDLRKYKSDYR